MFYYLTFGALLLSKYLGGYGKELRLFFYWLGLLTLFIISAFRYEVGCDWGNYEQLFQADFLQEIGGLSGSVATGEFAYVGLIIALNELGFSYTYLNFFTSLIFFYGIHKLAIKQPNPLSFLVLAFPFLIINLPMSGIRQAAAIGFICLAIIAFNERKVFKYSLFILFGTLFHSSAIIFFILTPFIKRKFSLKNILLFSFLIIPFIIFLSNSIAATYMVMRYLEIDIEAAGAIYRLSLVAATGTLFLLFLSKKWKSLYPQDHKITLIGSWGMVLCLCLIPISTVIADRVGYYLLPFQLMVLSRLYYLPGRYRQVLYIAPFIIFTFVFLVWSNLSTHFLSCYLPYQFSFG